MSVAFRERKREKNDKRRQSVAVKGAFTLADFLLVLAAVAPAHP